MGDQVGGDSALCKSCNTRHSILEKRKYVSVYVCINQINSSEQTLEEAIACILCVVIRLQPCMLENWLCSTHVRMLSFFHSKIANLCR